MKKKIVFKIYFEQQQPARQAARNEFQLFQTAAGLAIRENETVHFSQPGTECRQIHVIFHVQKTWGYLSEFFLSFSSETARFEMFMNISLGGSTEPFDPPQISLRHIQYTVGGHCNFTHDCVPPSHQFINNLLSIQPRRVNSVITHTDTSVEPLPQFPANRFTDKNVDMSAKEMSQDECLLHLFFVFLLSLSERFVPVFPKTFFVPLFPKIFCLFPPVS